MARLLCVYLTMEILDKIFEEYKNKNKNPNFGFDGLGEFVYERTYSRLKDDGKKRNME